MKQKVDDGVEHVERPLGMEELGVSDDGLDVSVHLEEVMEKVVENLGQELEGDAVHEGRDNLAQEIQLVDRHGLFGGAVEKVLQDLDPELLEDANAAIVGDDLEHEEEDAEQGPQRRLF